MNQLLRFTDVELYYDHVYALKGVTLELNEGETVALIGANGAGKSSILRAITGLTKVRRGEIHFDGTRIDQDFGPVRGTVTPRHIDGRLPRQRRDREEWKDQALEESGHLRPRRLE